MRFPLILVMLLATAFALSKAEALNKPMSIVSEAQKKALVKEAADARKKAYAPYSNFYVGAALLTSNGQMYDGCNVENASYPMSVCAERTAILKAVSNGASDIIAMAVVVPGGGTPCGACRQVMNEFNPQMPVYYGDLQGNLIGETTLQTLLPDAFGPHNLEKQCICK